MPTDVRNPYAAGNALRSFNDAEFRAWGQAMSDSLVAAGLTKCSGVEVSGQINWATVLRPTSSDQMMGFECFKFTDALQATSPVFIKVSYGAASGLGGGVNYPGITIVVVNGAIDSTGAPVGTAPQTYSIEFGMTRANLGPWPQGAFQTCGANNRIAQRWSCGQSAGGGDHLQWGVERTKNADGSDNGDGVIVVAQSGGSMYNRWQTWMTHADGANGGGFYCQVLINNGDVNNQLPSGVQNWCRAPYVFPAGAVIRTGGQRSGIFGGNTAVWPWILPSSRGYENPGMNFVGVWDTDIGDNAQFLARMYGADHNYRKGKASEYVGGGWFDSGADGAVLTMQPLMASAMRWE